MSDLAAASEAMKVPEPLVERSARAWAAASGASYEDVVAGWGGGTAVATAPIEAAATEAEADNEPETETETETAPQTPPEPAAPATPATPAPVPVAAAVEVEPEVAVEPLPLGQRLKLAGRIGAWTGAVLGLLGVVLASTWLLGLASLAGEEGAYAPAVEVTASRFIVGVTLLSVVFGVVVATFSRAAAGWVAPGAKLEGRFTLTVMLGAVLGAVLGLGSGAVMLSAFSEPIEGMEGVTLMRVVPAVFVVLLGGAVLGWLTSALVQVAAVPTGVDDEDAAEIDEVRGRLAAAVSIPVAAVVLLALLVIPLGLVFVRSNEMASGGAALLAVFAAIAILGISTLSASRPTMRISFGEFLVAVAGIATVVVIVFAVFQTRAGPEEEEAAEEETATEETVPDGTATTGTTTATTEG